MPNIEIYVFRPEIPEYNGNGILKGSNKYLSKFAFTVSLP